jgi:hypothetical protein
MFLKFKGLIFFIGILFVFSCSKKNKETQPYSRNFNQLIEKSLRDFNEWNDTTSKYLENRSIASLYASGIKACRVGSTRNALRLGDLCYDLATESSSDSDFTLAYHLIGKGSTLAKNYNKANESFTKAVEFAQKSKFDLVLPYIYSDLAELQIHLQKPGIGLDLLKKVEKSPEVNKSFPLLMAVQQFSSEAYLNLGQTAKSKKIANSRLELALKNRDLNQVAKAKNQLCAIELKLNNVQNARKINDEVVLILQNSNDHKEKENAYFQGLTIAKAQQDAPNVFAFQEKMILLKEQLLNEEQSGSQDAFFNSMEWNRVERERNQMVEITERNRFLMIIGGLVLAFVSTSLILTYRLGRKMKLANLKLTAKNREIHRKNEEIEKKSEELNRLNRVLEAKIQERTQKLIHQNNKLREVAYYNSHRVRGPLSTIMGLVDLYHGKMLDDVQLLMNEIDNHSRELDRNLFEINELLKKEDPGSN